MMKKNKKLRIDENMPVASCGDRVCVNQKAAHILRDLFGFDLPGNLNLFTVLSIFDYKLWIC